MIPYRTVIFDLDGTLLDTLQDLADSTNYVLALHKMPLRSLDEIRRFVGNGVGQLIHLAVPAGTPEQEKAQCLADFRAHYLLNMENRTAPYPGILALLDSLNQAGIKLAVVSNKFDGAVKGLCASYFGDRIRVAIGESETVARKPAPDTVLRALAELEADAEGAVYVGDSEVDIETARNAGLPCLSVSWGFRDADFLRSRGARSILSSPAALLALLTGAEGSPDRL
nr:HAD-IA family hydrolase [uncultured Flavonifractor sp.]